MESGAIQLISHIMRQCDQEDWDTYIERMQQLLKETVQSMKETVKQVKKLRLSKLGIFPEN